MTEFEVNDLVMRVKGGFTYGGTASDVPMKCKGKVIGVDNMNNNCLVEFDGKRGRCEYRMKFDEIALCKPEKPKITITYKPGENIDKYVDNVLKVETDRERKKWLRSYRNCVLPENVKRTIEEALTIVLRADVLKKWGVEEHFEKGIANTILLHGPPGTGKTMICESIAGVLGMNMMKLDTSMLQSNMPGQTERNIKANFQQAEKENAVLMFDECDSLLYDRNSVGAVMSAEINALLTEIERFKGIVVLTTNRLNKLDIALQRRIMAKIELPMPDKKAREQIWKNLIPKKMPVDKLNYSDLAEAELSGGEIKNAILLSVRKAIAQNKDKVDMKHFISSVSFVLKEKEDYNKCQWKEVTVR